MDLTLLGLAGPVSSQTSGSKGAGAPVGGDFAQHLAALGGQAAPPRQYRAPRQWPGT